MVNISLIRVRSRTGGETYRIMMNETGGEIKTDSRFMAEPSPYSVAINSDYDVTSSVSTRDEAGQILRYNPIHKVGVCRGVRPLPRL